MTWLSARSNGWWIHIVTSALLIGLANLIPQLIQAAPLDANTQALLLTVGNAAASWLRQRAGLASYNADIVRGV